MQLNLDIALSSESDSLKTSLKTKLSEARWKSLPLSVFMVYVRVCYVLPGCLVCMKHGLIACVFPVHVPACAHIWLCESVCVYVMFPSCVIKKCIRYRPVATQAYDVTVSIGLLVSQCCFRAYEMILCFVICHLYENIYVYCKNALILA